MTKTISWKVPRLEQDDSRIGTSPPPPPPPPPPPDIEDETPLMDTCIGGE